MNEREYIHNVIYRMKVGEEVLLDGRWVARGFPHGYFSIYNNTVEALLSSLIGSGCGAFRAKVNPRDGNILVSRHEESDKRYYIDPDRAHMFDKQQDGTLEIKPEFEIKPPTPTSDKE